MTVLHTAWVLIAVLATVYAVLNLPARLRLVQAAFAANQNELLQLGLSPSGIVAYMVALNIVVVLALDAISLLIFIRRARNWVAMLVSLAFVLQGVDQLLLIGNNPYVMLARSTDVISAGISDLGFGLGVISVFLFPDGRFVPRWSWVAVPALVAGIIFSMILPAAYHSPLPQALGIVSETGFYALGLASLIYRYFSVANAEEREQVKWILFGYGCLVLIWASYGLSLIIWPLQNLSAPRQILRELTGATIMTISGLILAGTFANAIIRHKLWDINFIINRTLVYLPLTGILAGVYTAAVTLLQRLFILFTGGQSMTAYVVATLLIAATFTPLKEVLQKAADRRFKEAPDRTRRLVELTNHVRAVVDIFDVQRMTGKLLDEAMHAFGAQAGAIFLGSKPNLELVHRHGEMRPGDAAVSIPLAVDGRELGVLELAPRPDGKAYSERDRKILEEAAEEVARAMELAPVERMEA